MIVLLVFVVVALVSVNVFLYSKLHDQYNESFTERLIILKVSS